MCETKNLIFYSVAILIGVILHLLFRKKIIDKIVLQVIIATWLFSMMYYNLCFSLIDLYAHEVFSLSGNSYVYYIQVIPLIIIITFYCLYWLKHFRCKKEKSSEKAEPNDSIIIFITFAASTALINLFLPPINELWIKLVIMLSFGAFMGFVAGLILWRNKKRK